ncbi:MAG: hypothetical protein RL758_135 [Pseudomonadota bacterium]|jgi:hypothetical protein
MDPINYSVDVKDPFQAALQGYSAGAAIRDDRQKQAMLAQQQQAQLAAQQQLLQAQQEVFKNPTADNYARLMTLDPKSSEAYQRAWTTRSTEQQRGLASDLLQWGAAIKSGKPQLAADALAQRADLLEQQNGGQPTQDSQAMRAYSKLAAEHPEFALGQIQAMLAVNPTGKDAAETLGKFGAEQRAAELQPSAMREAAAKATTAEVGAKYAESAALKELEVKGWNIENIKSEIGYRKEANRIAAMNAAANRESNDLKRQELKQKIQETQQAMDDKARAKVADVESATSSIDNLLNTVDRLKQNKSLDSVIGSIQGRLPAVVSDEANDAISLIDTLGSQAFMSQIPAMKGTGALSEKEGAKLQSSLQNLSRVQSEDQFRTNLDEVQRLMLKARKGIETRYGVKAGPPDTPAVKTSPGDIDALVNKYLNPQPLGAR